MTLTRRLTTVALGSLIAVLVTFSVATYSLVRTREAHHDRERLNAALDVLLASAELEPTGWEWEPGSHKTPPRSDEMLWAVYSNHNELLDGDRDDVLRPDSRISEGTIVPRIDHTGVQRLVMWRTTQLPGGVSSEYQHTLKRLTLVAAISTARTEETLNSLIYVLASVSCAIGLVAAFVTRRICHRALAPVLHMTDSAKSIDGSDPCERLPVSQNHDELRELAITFNDLLARLQDSLHRQSRFAAEASHQLRTPLAALRGQLEVALRRERGTEEYQRTLTTASQQASRLQGIVESLLFLARDDRDAALPQLTPVDLVTWIKDHVTASWGASPRFGAIHFVTPTKMMSMRIAPNLLGQAIDNFLENAMKYGPQSGTIDIGIEEDDSGVTLFVDDEGGEIAETDVAQLFDPFFRSESFRQQGTSGLGLGLAISRKIAKAHDGNAVYQRTSHRKNRFAIILKRPR